MEWNAQTNWPDAPVPPKNPASPVLRAVLILAGLAVFVAILVPIVAQRPELSRKQICLADLKRAETAVLMYASDYSDTFPRARWMDAALPYVNREDYLRCIEATRQDSRAFGRSFELDWLGRRLAQVNEPASAEMIFDSQATHRNAVSRIGWGIVHPGRHQGGTNVGFIDGHVKWLSDGETTKRWPAIIEERTVE